MTNTFRRQWRRRRRWGRSLIRKEFNAPPSPNGYFRPRPIRTQWLFQIYFIFIQYLRSSCGTAAAYKHIHTYTVAHVKSYYRLVCVQWQSAGPPLAYNVLAVVHTRNLSRLFRFFRRKDDIIQYNIAFKLNRAIDLSVMSVAHGLRFERWKILDL